jgi:hypothetical protein
MKQYYSCIDVRVPSPQPEQHQVSKMKAIKEKGQIIFYGAEEYRTSKYQPYILEKLQRTPGIDGVIFFSIEQFCYGEKFNLRLLSDILKIKLTVHFAREDISFNNIDEINEKFLNISVYFNSHRRRREFNTKQLISDL